MTSWLLYSIVSFAQSESIKYVESASNDLRLALDWQNRSPEATHTEFIRLKTSRIGSSRLCLRRALHDPTIGHNYCDIIMNKWY